MLSGKILPYLTVKKFRRALYDHQNMSVSETHPDSLPVMKSHDKDWSANGKRRLAFFSINITRNGLLLMLGFNALFFFLLIATSCRSVCVVLLFFDSSKAC
jgi:hypothetical protein